MQRTSRAVRRHRRIISLLHYLTGGRIQVAFPGQRFSRRRQRRRVRFRLQPFEFALRPRDIRCLAADFPDELRLLQPLLLLLLIKYLIKVIAGPGQLIIRLADRK
ncbi:hypothetical protein ACQE32_07170 [Pantoea sp. FN0302]|uniref:hypothetical protein n=1 Tax=Pantoea sp. FN0302 TaxID=3418558 RepID=UPI003CEF7F68